MEGKVVDFYESKKRLSLIAVGCVLFVLLCLYLSFVFFFVDVQYLIGTVVALGGLFFLVCLIQIFKKLSHDVPHVSMTGDYLIIYVIQEHPVQIRWEDIESYLPYEIYRNAFIGLILKDEDKYRDKMPDKLKRMSRMNVKMGYPQYNIVISNLKKPQQMLEELSTRIPNSKICAEGKAVATRNS
ncbi:MULTISPECIES: STM3941 family protein [Rossellomorea]|uniref:STM3941 family protein n=1 Tax=Rossellomorea TaxID=2837508 RepID=UPI00296EAE76|nr:STM3941 family protein [Rossellomorea aquimaris]